MTKNLRLLEAIALYCSGLTMGANLLFGSPFLFIMAFALIGIALYAKGQQDKVVCQCCHKNFPTICIECHNAEGNDV